jgi:hypothetical protein
VLASLPARYVHLLVDACHAEAVVRPRGADLPSVPVETDEARSALERGTLARFPHAGAILAATRAQEAHEWDRLQHGVFTYELLSALRGGADVNLDGRVEYSEVFAFVAAANHGVVNPRAALDVRVYPPALNPGAQLVDLRTAGGAPRLEGDGRGSVSLRIEDDLGRSVAAVHAEAGVRFNLALPSGRGFFVRAADGREAEFQPAAGERVPFASLSWRAAGTRARGALDTALDRGLFLMPFGPAYYRGFVGARPELMAVAMSSAPEGRWDQGADPFLSPSGYAFAGATVLGVMTAVLTAAAISARGDFDEAPYQKESAEALDRLQLYRNLAIATGVAAAGAAGLGIYLKWRVAPVVEAGRNDRAFGIALRATW